MTDLVQPDLFGEYNAQQERARLAEQPATCPRCGTTEPNRLLLENNHGIDGPGADTISGWPRGKHPNYGDRCVAQDLATSHIHYDIKQGNDDALARSVARGRELGLDTDAIIAQARQADTTE